MRVKPNQSTPGKADGNPLAHGCRQWPVYGLHSEPIDPTISTFSLTNSAVFLRVASVISLKKTPLLKPQVYLSLWQWRDVLFVTKNKNSMLNVIKTTLCSLQHEVEAWFVDQ